MALLIGVGLFVALGVLARLFGADSRDGRDWQSYDGPGSNHAGKESPPLVSGGTIEGTRAGCAR